MVDAARDADGSGPSYDVRREWLLQRVDSCVGSALAATLRDAVELLAVATGDAASLRSLSADGARLLPVAAHHPDPRVDDAMSEVMARSVQPADIGLWRPVIEHRRPRRYEMEPGEPDPQASAQQRAFMAEFPITAVLGVPLLAGGTVLGGLSLVRFTRRRPFSDTDEDLVLALAERIAPVLAAHRETRRSRDVGDATG